MTVSKVRSAAALLGALAVLVQAPGTATAGPSGAGCTHTDAGGRGVALANGQDVPMDGKIVSCRSGKVTVTDPPERKPKNPGAQS